VLKSLVRLGSLGLAWRLLLCSRAKGPWWGGLAEKDAKAPHDLVSTPLEIALTAVSGNGV
jgi:hypothetical protein